MRCRICSKYINQLQRLKARPVINIREKIIRQFKVDIKNDPGFYPTLVHLGCYIRVHQNRIKSCEELPTFDQEDDLPDAIPKAIPDAIPKAIPDTIPKAITDAIPEAIPDDEDTNLEISPPSTSATSSQPEPVRNLCRICGLEITNAQSRYSRTAESVKKPILDVLGLYKKYTHIFSPGSNHNI